MAEFCKGCAKEYLGDDPKYNDFAGRVGKGQVLDTICEGCGPGIFDYEGNRLVSIAEIVEAQAEIKAMDVLLHSAWWQEECENANYHTIHSFMRECYTERKEFAAKESQRVADA